MMNIELSSPLKVELAELVLSKLWNSENIVEVTQRLQRLRIVNSGIPSLKEDTTNKRTPLQIQILSYRFESFVAFGVELFIDNTFIGKVISPNLAQTLHSNQSNHSNHLNHLNNQRSSIMNLLLYFVGNKDGKEDPVKFVEDVKIYVNIDEYPTVAKAKQTLRSHF